MAESGARLVDVGTTNRTRLADYRARPRSQRRRRRAHPQGAPVELPDRGLHRRRGGRRRSPRSGRRVVVDIGSGLLDAACPWLTGGPPAVAARRAGGTQTLEAGAALVTFSRRQAARRPAGRRHRRARRPRRRVRCATRSPGRCAPAGSCSRRCRTIALAYLRRDGDAIPFWRMATTPVGDAPRPGRGDRRRQGRRHAGGRGRAARFPASRSRRSASRSTAITPPPCAPHDPSDHRPRCTTARRSATSAPSIRCTTPRSCAAASSRSR